ncbi:MAG: Holliday junction branch migration protein RuvA [Candidatus Eisenbacteria bacterium]
MIAELKGTLLRRSPAGVVVDVGGIGFSMLVPLSTFRELGDEGSEVHLFTYLHVREDALDLYAFNTVAERSIFRALISVSGIGPKLGLAVLSGLSPDVFHRAVIEEDIGLLTSVTGIGKKTAQRMIIELKERLSGLDVSSIGGSGSGKEDTGDAVLALMSLGMNRNSAREAVLRVQGEAGCELSLEELVRRALRRGA